MKQAKRDRSSIPSLQNLDVVETVGSHSTMTNPTTKTIIHDGKTYFCHPDYENYGCSTDGYIINRKRLIPRKGRLNPNGYLFTTVISNDNKIKIFTSNRMIWESVNQKIIPDGYQIHHINCDKQDNSIENLELVTRKQNMIYAGKQRRGQTISKKQNVPIKCEVFHYHHIYTNYGANKYGQIYNKKTKRCSTGNLQSTGYRLIKLSQIGLSHKIVYVHRLVFECIKDQIPEGYEINHIDSNKQNNCINNLELMTHSENIKHAYKSKKYKTKIEITTDKPIESIKLDIKLKESDDDFTDEEKKSINDKYNAIVAKIKNGDFPYKKQLQEHFPDVEFW